MYWVARSGLALVVNRIKAELNLKKCIMSWRDARKKTHTFTALHIIMLGCLGRIRNASLLCQQFSIKLMLMVFSAPWRTIYTFCGAQEGPHKRSTKLLGALPTQHLPRWKQSSQTHQSNDFLNVLLFQTFKEEESFKVRVTIQQEQHLSLARKFSFYCGHQSPECLVSILCQSRWSNLYQTSLKYENFEKSSSLKPGSENTRYFGTWGGKGEKNLIVYSKSFLNDEMEYVVVVTLVQP